MNYKYTSRSEEDTLEIAENIESEKFPGMVICLNGELGSGKTVFVKGFANALEVKETITSPTFSLIKEYDDGELPLYHMDLYNSDGNITDDGFDDDFYDEPSNPMIKTIKNAGPEMSYLSEFPSTIGRYIAIDAEFTGLDEKEDQLLELAACEVYNCQLTGKKFHIYINPRGEIKGTEFHGITKETYNNLPA